MYAIISIKDIKDQRLKCNKRAINVLQEITVTAAPSDADDQKGIRIKFQKNPMGWLFK